MDQLVLTSSVSYTVSATFIKLSLLTFFIRLSNGPKFLALVYVVVFVVISFGISSVTTVLLQCIPLSALWDAKVAATARCIRVTDFYYANAAINITTDVMILLLPLRILWGLHMPLRQRISLCGLFGLGGLYVHLCHFISQPQGKHCSFRSKTNKVDRACVAGVIRLTTIDLLINSKDPTVDLTTPLNWSIIELNVSIFIAGAPALKTLLRRWAPALLGSSYSPSGPTPYAISKSRPTHAGSIPLGSMNDRNDTVWKNEVTAGGEAVADDSDNGSQENILSYHGILHEVTVSVKSERRSLSTQAPSQGVDDDTKVNFQA